MRITILLSLSAVIFCVAWARPARGATTAEAAVAAEAAPHAVDLATDVAQVPFAAAEVLYLPLGTGEVLLSPLPGISAIDGVVHVGKGILAPFKLGIAVLKLPYKVLKKGGAVVGLLPSKNP